MRHARRTAIRADDHQKNHIKLLPLQRVTESHGHLRPWNPVHCPTLNKLTLLKMCVEPDHLSKLALLSNAEHSMLAKSTQSTSSLKRRRRKCIVRFI